MGLSVEFKDVTPRNFKLAGDHSFSVSVAGQKLGYLILTPSDLVLSWNGRMDFAVLEEQVLGELPRSFCAGPISAQGNDVKILTRKGGKKKKIFFFFFCFQKKKKKIFFFS